MRIYNTLTRQKEEFVPLVPKKVSIYACGPTVYNFIHIGNARPICVFDTLRRYFEYRGYEVRFVQNFTDIDDKLINRANEEGTTVTAIAEKYIAEYNIDAEGLGVRPATVQPKATETIDTIIEVVSDLMEKDYAYESDGSVYFSSRKFEDYGKLSNQPLEELEASSRSDFSEQKRDALDFVLWKAAKPGEPFWESPWGKGRPGWHIECTAMIKKHLGNTIDIHCGGSDLVFPHHENEIAQGKCSAGTDYARYWMHNGFINVDNKKMSKSLGNFFTVRDVAEKFGYEPIKFMMLQAHYRSPINYSYDVIEQCKAALDRLYACRDNLSFAAEHSAAEATEEDRRFCEGVDKWRDAFTQAMEDDLNTADAIAVLFEMVRDCNTYFVQPRGKESSEYALGVFNELAEVLGLLYARKEGTLEDEVEALIDERQQARKNRDFKRADEIRDELKSRGIILEDTPQGVKWRREA
jgi:cysteinyl-tRNA synthetase